MHLEVRTNGKGDLGRRLKEYGEIKFERSDIRYLILWTQPPGEESRKG